MIEVAFTVSLALSRKTSLWSMSFSQSLLRSIYSVGCVCQCCYPTSKGLGNTASCNQSTRSLRRSACRCTYEDQQIAVACVYATSCEWPSGLWDGAGYTIGMDRNQSLRNGRAELGLKTLSKRAVLSKYVHTYRYTLHIRDLGCLCQTYLS
jgi:hypothetical protein